MYICNCISINLFGCFIFLSFFHFFSAVFVSVTPPYANTDIERFQSPVCESISKSFTNVVSTVIYEIKVRIFLWDIDLLAVTVFHPTPGTSYRITRIDTQFFFVVLLRSANQANQGNLSVTT